MCYLFDKEESRSGVLEMWFIGRAHSLYVWGSVFFSWDQKKRRKVCVCGGGGVDFFSFWGAHPAVLGAYSWFCALGSVLQVVGQPYVVAEIELGSAVCKHTHFTKSPAQSREVWKSNPQVLSDFIWKQSTFSSLSWARCCVLTFRPLVPLPEPQPRQTPPPRHPLLPLTGT